jgi:signal transduction histidine kinase
MSALLKSLVCGAIALSLSVPAFAAGKSGQDDAISIVKKAIDYMKKNGNEKAFAEFNRLDSPFNTMSDINPNGDLYMLVYQPDGVQPVHGKNPKIPGKNVMEMRDGDGIYLIKEMIKTCTSKEGHGWVKYKWPNSITNKLDAKQTYIEKFGDYCVGAGIYQ